MPVLPIAATLSIGPEGNMHNISTCAEIIGLNCHFDPFVTLDSTEQMKIALHGKEWY